MIAAGNDNRVSLSLVGEANREVSFSTRDFNPVSIRQQILKLTIKTFYIVMDLK